MCPRKFLEALGSSWLSVFNLHEGGFDERWETTDGRLDLQNVTICCLCSFQRGLALIGIHRAAQKSAPPDRLQASFSIWPQPVQCLLLANLLAWLGERKKGGLMIGTSPDRGMRRRMIRDARNVATFSPSGGFEDSEQYGAWRDT